MYVIQLNGEPHYVQATSAVLSAAGTTAATAIALNHADLPANTYIQQTHLEPQIQTVQQPTATTVIHQQTDAFQDVIDYVQNLYADLAKEKHFSTYFCLFCTQEFVDLRLLLRHTSYAHRTKILDGTTNLDQDFEALVRKKLELKEQQAAAASQQLYQCVQCQQMFNSLEVISEHLNHCQVGGGAAAAAANVLQTAGVVDTVTVADTLATYQPKIEVPEPKPAANARDHYVPYGCAQCGRRYFTIRELMDHLPTCTAETFYEAAHYLHQKYWVGAPKDQHIVINEESTNCILKTSGLWLMPEHADSQAGSLDLNRGFWVLPSSTTDFLAEQREQEEKLRLQQEQQQRLLQEQQEKLRIQEEQKRLRDEQEKRERDELLLQRQLIEQQEKLRIQQQIQEQQQKQQQQQQQQQQLMLQQQLQRQSQSVVQTIASTAHAVPLVKASPTPVISHQAHGGRHDTTANTIIVLNDEYLSPSASEALKCIQASDGSYHVIGSMDLNERHTSNTTSVIAHTSPAAATIAVGTAAPPAGQGRRKRATAANNVATGRTPTIKPTITYTQPAPGSNQHIVTLDNVYEQAAQPAKPTNAKRKRGGGGGGGIGATQTITTMDVAGMQHMVDPVATVQTLETADMPAQQFYIAYNDNGVLVPIDAPSTSSAVLGEHTTHTSVEVLNLSQDQYIIEDLDASRKAQQQKRRKRSGASAVPPQGQALETIAAAAAAGIADGPSTSHHMLPPAVQTVDSSINIPGYDIDDLSHLDRPIAADGAAQVTPIKPLTSKPQFVDSFFSFLMNRESNKL